MFEPKRGGHERPLDMSPLDISDFKFPTEDEAKDGVFAQHERLLAFVHKASRLILEFSSKFCQIDLYDTLERDKLAHGSDSCEQNQPPAFNGPPWEAPDARRRADGRFEVRRARWPKFVYLLNIYCFIRLTLNMSRQYEHDKHVLRLSWVSRHPDEAARFEPADVLRARINETRRALKAMGAPHINGTIASECVYLTLLMLSLAYISSHIYFNFVAKFDLYLLRAILDRRREQRNCNQLIMAQANKFIESRRNFADIRLAQSGLQLTALLDVTPLERSTMARHLTQTLLLDQQLLVGQLKLMARAGALVPLNRTDAWLDLMCCLYFIMNFLLACWSVIFNLAFYSLLAQFVGFTLELEPLDMLFALDLVLISLICCGAIFFYIITTTISCLDQARLIAQVRQLLTNCTRDNLRLYNAQAGALQSSSNSPLPIAHSASCLCLCEDCLKLRHGFESKRLKIAVPRLQYARLNANLLHALMHYKVFVAQLRPILKPVGYVAFVSIVFALVHPVLIRLHTPYLASVKLKSSYYIISLITACFVNMNTLPACYVNSRCIDLYKALHSLLAHTMELTLANSLAAPSDQDNDDDKLQRPAWAPAGEVYDSHSILALRRELKLAESFVRQFETRAFGLTFTYGTLMRTYFWVGAITLAILVDPETGESGALLSANWFLRDPLGFYATA